MTLAFLIAGAAVVVTGILLVIGDSGTVHRSSTLLWTLACVTSVFGVVGLVIFREVPNVDWIVPFTAGATTLSFGLIWSGLRVFAGARSGGVIVAIATAVTMIAAISDTQSGMWNGAAVRFGVLACLSLAVLAICLDARMRRRPAMRIIAVLACLQFAYSLARLVAFLYWGAAEPRFETFFGAQTATLVNALCVVGAAFALVALRAERGREIVHESTGRHFVGRRGFARAVRRAEGDDAVRVSVEDFSTLRTAMGRGAAHAIELDLSGRLVEIAPEGAVIGRLGNGAFGMLVEGRHDLRDVVTGELKLTSEHTTAIAMIVDGYESSKGTREPQSARKVGG
ncbi:hypothetical protein [Agromyces atrinae]|uniref:Uncharacterized protein n=1 Tax=Agromyces atrinae TaxID=592376 RepID=A0A4Q2MC88_9MICO|nr:hypothetical protein [Agromyces atrinae]NYD68146.1 hypothetical protein [Agromyces atrinae]RXZ87711.1 hypothetical protein ESP50_00440 [Agromyces atrinae]